MKTKNLGSLSALILGLGLSLNLANAATFNEGCLDIATCAKVVGEILGQRYVFNANDIKGAGQKSIPDIVVTKENAELLFTGMLNEHGYSRVPSGIPNTFGIMRQRDARDSAIPLISADHDNPPQLPETWDICTMKYKAAHPEVVEQIARNSRSFMPAASRIVPDELSGTLLVTDTAMNLKKLYQIIILVDQKPNAEMKKKWEAESLRRRAEARADQKERREHPSHTEGAEQAEHKAPPAVPAPVPAK